MPLWDRVPRIDRQKGIRGVLSNGMTFWTLAVPDTTIDSVVLADTAFGSDEGKVLQAANAGGTIVYINGNYTAGCAVVGRNYTATLDLSDPYPRDEHGRALIEGSFQVRDVTFRHRNTGKYQVRVIPDDTKRRTRKITFEADDNDIESTGKTTSFVGGSNDKVTIRIFADGPKPVTISTVNIEGDYSEG